MQLSISDMILHAGPVGQLVMLTLLIFSIVSWTIVIMKVRLFKKVRLDSEDFIETFWSSSNLSQAYGSAAEFEYSPQAQVFTAGFSELEHYYRPAGLPIGPQPWLASVWRKCATAEDL